MNYLKKFITKAVSVTLAALMALSMGAAVMAKSYKDVETTNDYKAQIDLLSDVGVIVGTSADEFTPNAGVTREQMALLLFRLMLGRSNAGTTNSTAFKDLYDSTYSGAISWANASGFIIGTSATTFEPTGGIKLQDAMTMVVRALGQANSSMNGGYPWTYIDAAVKLGLDKGLENMSYTATLTRAQTAALLYNAFTADMLISKTSTNGGTYVEKSTIAQYVFGYEIGEGILSATNTYAIGNVSTVLKDGYVTFVLANGSAMTVKFASTGLSGTPEEWLGKSVKLIYNYDSTTKLVNVIGATAKGETENYNNISVAADNSYVTIGNEKYNIVAAYSNILSTNVNELLVYAYDNAGNLTQITTNAAVKPYLGIYNVELIGDDKDGIAERALIKNYKFGQLTVTDNKINLAGGLTSDALTGGYVNTVGAKSGDYVLYYYNTGIKRLEIAKILKAADSALVTRMTDTTATVGGTTYTLGNSAAGVSASAIKAQLTVGQNASIIAENGYIFAVIVSNTTVKSTYLVAMTNAMPVYTDGALKYIVKANIDGTATDIVVTNTAAVSGKVYRYTVSAGVYTLYADSASTFAQSGQFANISSVAANTLVTKGSGTYFTINGINFVTDADTTILVKNGSTYTKYSGIYNGTITLNAGANVTAVYINNVGSVETLLYLYVDNGSVDTTQLTTQYVKVLKATGTEYADGAIYNVYEVFNFTTGVRETRSSLNALTVGNTYALDSNGKANPTAVATLHGVVSGYTASTVTINNTVYSITSATPIYTIAADLTLTSQTLASICYKDVEFMVSGTAIRSIIVNNPLSFTASYDAAAKTVTFTPSALYGGSGAAIQLVSVVRDGTALNVADWNLTLSANDTLKTQLYYISAGNYVFTFKVNGQTMVSAIQLPAVNP